MKLFPAVILGSFAVICLAPGCDPNEPEPWIGDPDEFEVDDTRPQAKVQLVHASAPRHTFAPDGDHDYIRFRVTELYTGDAGVPDPGPLYQFGLLDTAGSPQLQILDAQGGAMPGLNLFFVEPGTYYLHVYEADGAGGEYRPAIALWKDAIPTGGHPPIVPDQVGGKPDLVVASASVPATVASGGSLDIGVRYGNQGGVAIASFTLTAYVSTKRTLDGGTETQVGTKVVTGGAAFYWTFADDVIEATLGGGLPTGPVYVIVAGASVMGESDGANNAAVASTLLDVAAGDWHEPDGTPLEADAVAGIGTTAPDVADLTIFDVADSDLVRIITPDPSKYLEIWTDRLRGGADTKIEVVEAAEAGNTLAPAVVVTVLDASGNVDTGFTGDVTVAIGANPGGGALSGTTTVAAVAGVATFSDLSVDAAGAGYTLAASAAGPAGAGSAAFDVAPDTAVARLVFTAQPSPAVAGGTITPAVVVTALDALGATDTTFTDDVTVAIGANPGGGTLAGTTTVAAVAGVATFSDLSVAAAGSGYTLAASAAGAAGTGSAAFDVAPAVTGTRLVFTDQPSSTATGSVVTPAVVVTVTDEFGATVTGFTDNVTLAIGANPGGGILSGTTTVAAAAGVATFSDLSVDAAGAGYTLAASAAGAAGTGSAAFDVVAANVTRLAFAVDPCVAVIMSTEDGGQENGASHLVVPPGALVSGPYYVRVTDENEGTGGYDLHVRESTAQPDIQEPDDAFLPALGIATWRTLLPGNNVSRNFSGDGADLDYMVYPVNVGSPASHTIQTQDVSAGCATRLTLLHADGTNAELGVDGGSGTWTISAVTLEPGLYYIKVENISSPLVPGSYTVATSN